MLVDGFSVIHVDSSPTFQRAACKYIIILAPVKYLWRIGLNSIDISAKRKDKIIEQKGKQNETKTV